MGKLILYGDHVSPPVRSCLLTLKALNIPYEYVHIDLFTGQHMSEEYLKKNPQHTVPTLEDDGHFIWDSHAIMTYLARKYGKDDSLYPKDFQKRALVDQRLHFESGVVYNTLRNITLPIWMNNVQVPQHKIDAVYELYNTLEVLLKDTPYIAGDHLTLADLSIVPTVTSCEIFAGIDGAKYPKIAAWIKRVQSVPYYEEADKAGGELYVKMLKAKNFTIVKS